MLGKTVFIVKSQALRFIVMSFNCISAEAKYYKLCTLLLSIFKKGSLAKFQQTKESCSAVPAECIRTAG